MTPRAGASAPARCTWSYCCSRWRCSGGAGAGARARQRGACARGGGVGSRTPRRSRRRPTTGTATSSRTTSTTARRSGYDDLRTATRTRTTRPATARGDWCEADDDDDGVLDWTDQQVEYESDAGQARQLPDDRQPATRPTTTSNGVGDACEFDNDGDGVLDSRGQLPDASPTPTRPTSTATAIGDVCDNDDDGDFTRDNVDNCPRYPNPDQLDADGDGIGDAVRRRRHAAAPPPTPTPRPPTPTPADEPRHSSVVDRQAPRVTLSVRSTQRVAEVEDGLIVRVRCSEACTAKAERDRRQVGRPQAQAARHADRRHGNRHDGGRDDDLRVRALQRARPRPPVQAVPNDAHAEGHGHRSGREHPPREPNRWS